VPGKDSSEPRTQRSSDVLWIWITIEIMLEHRVLLVRSCTASSMQVIVDGESGVALGYARWATEPTPWWRRLFGCGVLAVHEQEDEPLLLTIHRAWSWLPRRCVCDAEGKPVGVLLGRLIHDRHGCLVATLENGIFHAPDRRLLAELTATAEGLRLTFSDDIAGEPFIKMLLLAATLITSRQPAVQAGV
jgi:hypothetical protein